MPYNSLRPIREKKGMTVAQLAGKTSISIRTLQSYEAGERAISPDDLRKLSRVLYVSPTEILQPTAPPPAPPPRPPEQVETAPVHRAPPVVPRAETMPHQPVGLTHDDVRRFPGSRGNHPRSPLPRPPRPPREASAPRVPGPCTPGQIEQIRNLARRMGLDNEALLGRVGAPLETLDHAGARAAIATLRKEMEESGTWQPRIAEGPDQEGEYLTKLRTQRIPIDVQLINGERFEGVVEDYTPYVIHLRESQSEADVYVRKLAIAYYRTRGSTNDAK